MAKLYDAENMRKLIGGYLIGTYEDLNEEGYLRVVRYRRRQLGQMTMALDTQTAKRRIPDGTYQVSRKVDGEYSVLIYENGEACLLNPGKTLRAGAPFLAEAATMLKAAGVKKAMIGGEFHYVRPDGKRARIHDIVAIGRAPQTPEEVDDLAFAAFNIYDLEGEDLSMNYQGAIEKLQELFNGGHRVFPVESVNVDDATGVLKQYKKWVLKEGEEGVVARSPNAGAFKIKPRHNIDLAVVGFTESSDDRAGMLHDMLLAVIRPSGSFQIVSRVGGGFSDAQRVEFLELLQERVVESDFHEVNSQRVAYQMVKPGLVVEIQCLDLVSTTSRGNTIDRMILDYNGEDGKWEGVRRLPLCSVISPQFIRFRDDKEAQKDDVRLSQLTDIISIPDIDRVAEQVILPESVIHQARCCRQSDEGRADGPQARHVEDQQGPRARRFSSIRPPAHRFFSQSENNR